MCKLRWRTVLVSARLSISKVSLIYHMDGICVLSSVCLRVECDTGVDSPNAGRGEFAEELKNERAYDD